MTGGNDLIVIGGGAAGLAAACTAARAGRRATLVTDGPPGGDCTFTGCVPSKTLTEVAARGTGFTEAMAAVRAGVARIAATEDETTLERAGIAVVRGRARFTGPGTIEVDGRTVRASRFVVATGARPARPRARACSPAVWRRPPMPTRPGRRPSSRPPRSSSAPRAAEVVAREVASQIAVGTPVARLDLPDAEDHPVQVTAKDGRALGSATRVMLIGLPVLLLVVAAVTWLVTRRAFRPVEAIRAEMAAITSAGDLARRVPVPDSGDEIAALASTTNETLGALEHSVERQRRFVADASHELRSPLASLRTQLEVAAVHPHLLDIDGTVQDVIRLQDLAADLLLLARLDAGEHPRRGRVDLAALVRDELAHRGGDRIPIRMRAAAATDQTAPEVEGNGSQLARALRNLLDNAERHAAGSVEVELAAADGRVHLRVLDDGPGVPASDREQVFERFVRLDDARTRDEGGAGLVLAIARGIARSHGGDLTVTDAPDGAAAFDISLPGA